MTAWFCAFLLAFAWLVPLHVLPWVSWHSEVLAFAAVLVACIGGLRAGWSGLRGGVPLPSVVLLPALLGAAALLQWATGRIAYVGSVLTILAYVLLCVAAAAVGYSGARGHSGPVPALRLLAQVLVAIGLVQVFIVLAQCTFTWSGSDLIARTAYSRRGSGNVAQPNQAALLFVLAVASAVYLRQLALLSRPVLVAVLLPLLLGLATTQSRSGLLALAAVTGWTLWQARRLPHPAGAAHALVVLAFTAGSFAAWPALMNAYWGIGEEAVNFTTSGRSAMWAQLLSAVQLRPWTGWGVMQVAEAQNAIAHLHTDVMAATFSHNVFLDIALWVGVPGLLAVLLLSVRWLVPRVRSISDVHAMYCVALVTAAAVQALTEFPYAYGYILAPAFLALGILEARHGAGLILRMPRTAASVAVLACASVVCWSALEYVRIEEDFRVARFEALRVGETPSGYDVPQVHLLTQLDALLQATRVPPRPGMPPEDLELLRNVAMLHPWGATNFRYATALALNGDMEEAARQLQVQRALQGPAMHRRLLEALDEMAIRYPVLQQLRQP